MPPASGVMPKGVSWKKTEPKDADFITNVWALKNQSSDPKRWPGPPPWQKMRSGTWPVPRPGPNSGRWVRVRRSRLEKRSPTRPVSSWRTSLGISLPWPARGGPHRLCHELQKLAIPFGGRRTVAGELRRTGGSEDTPGPASLAEKRCLYAARASGYRPPPGAYRPGARVPAAARPELPGACQSPPRYRQRLARANAPLVSPAANCTHAAAASRLMPTTRAQYASPRWSDRARSNRAPPPPTARVRPPTSGGSDRTGEPAESGGHGPGESRSREGRGGGPVTPFQRDACGHGSAVVLADQHVDGRETFAAWAMATAARAAESCPRWR